VTRAATGVSFSVPEDALGSTIIVLDKPDWLVLPDADAPVIEAVSVGKTAAMQVSDDMNAGRLDASPPNITFTLRDKLNPISSSDLSVSLDGVNVTSAQGKVKIDRSRDGRRADVIITPGELSRDKHTLMLRVSDATPGHNVRTALLSFDTSPLLRNGDFETLRPDGTAEHWRVAAWSVKPDTKWETTVAKGAGRTGNAIKMTGTAGNIYLVVGQPVDVTPGATYIFSGYYKCESDQSCGASLYGRPEGDVKEQYTSTTFEPATDWTPFSWEVTAEQGHIFYEAFVVNTSHGTVYFDDLTLAPKE